MQLVNAGFEILTPESPLKHIERIGRVCYKSEDKITEDGESAKKFVKMLLDHNHGAMLEHNNIVFDVPKSIYNTIKTFSNSYDDFEKDGPSANLRPERAYLRFSETYDHSGKVIRSLVSGNLRSWCIWLSANRGYPEGIAEIIKEETEGVIDYTNTRDKYEEQGVRLVKDLSTLEYKEQWVHQTVSVMFTTDRGVTHELVRHRPASFAQESTRYCLYNNENKEGSELTFIDIKPTASDMVVKEKADNLGGIIDEWYSALEDAEKHYNNMIELGATPQFARSVLPNSTKANITVTANLEEWHHILNLRACNSTGPAHPQIREVMVPLLEEIKEYVPVIFDDLNVV
jgi:thymidylate synthase (FAD)